MGLRMSVAANGRPPKHFWVLSVLALLWNLIGVATYLATVTLSPEALANMTDAERALYIAPWWVTSVYAIAVFAGTFGCLALLFRKTWAFPLFIVSLIAVFIQTGYGLLMTEIIAVQGGAAAALPLTVVCVAIALVGFARAAAKRNWIH
jgi:hypothetical protein